ncbi:MAG: hypothetical protein HXY47_03795 [Nitrospirae bacterium]|nr:hypothetical protein [Nitrospirota bacterium]
MPRPLIRYLVSSPFGDIPADKDTWDSPLEGDELKTPYKIYFYSIKDFLLRDNSKLLLLSISKNIGKEIQPKEIDEILIRIEKHGILYHPASIEIICKDNRVKFCLNVAVSDLGRYWLKKEYNTIEELHTKFNLPYLPKTYFFGEFNSMSFLLEDWFDGYHEFHLSIDNKGKQQLKLWDFNKGYKYLYPEESFEIYKQASKILTSYYELEDFSQILGWHQAAGDFVAKIENMKVDVRLTTARQHGPFIGFTDLNTLNPILALLYFFLNLTLKMRLDKLDGIGEAAWADDLCIEATLTGFSEAMQSRKNLKSYLNFEVKDFLRLMHSFSQKELKRIVSPLIEQYKNTSDYPIIITNLDRHIEKLLNTLQNFLE